MKDWLENGQAIEFNSEALSILRGPGVYLYVKEDRAIYVGCSRSAVGRALSRNHHKRMELLKGTSLLIFPCKTQTAAQQLEEKLIFDLRPIGNERGGWKEFARILGYASTGTARHAYK